MNKIGIIITAYNEEEYIGNCLDALNAQMMERDRYLIVVVDNASSDRTGIIATEKGAVVIREEQKGIPYAFKAGMDYMCAHDIAIVACTDADSQAPPYWLGNIQVQMERRTDVVGLTGPVYFYDIPMRAIVNYLIHVSYLMMISISVLVGGFVQFIGSNMAFRLADYMRVGGINTKYLISADVDLSKRMSKLGRILFDPQINTYVSARRFKKQPVKALYQYGRGFFSVVFNKPTKIELDDIR